VTRVSRLSFPLFSTSLCSLAKLEKALQSQNVGALIYPFVLITKTKLEEILLGGGWRMIYIQGPES